MSESAAAFAALDVAINLHHQGPIMTHVGTAALKVRAACACGVPVVVFRAPGAEALEDAGVGRVAEPSGAGLAGALRPLLTDSALRVELGTRGRAHAVEHWGWERLGAKLVVACEAAAARHPRR